MTMARIHLRCCLLGVILSILARGTNAETFETVRNSNAAIFNRLGLTPVLMQDGHHRKRLAGPEPGRTHQTNYGRHHADDSSSHDSHVYVVKLPASPPYYTFSKPHKSLAGDGRNVTQANPNVGFHSNGKPAKIYHWNLPMLKKMNEKKRRQSQLKMEQLKKKHDVERERQNYNKMNYFNKKNHHGETNGKVDLPMNHVVQDPSRITKPRNNDKRLNYLGNAERSSSNTQAVDSTKFKVSGAASHKNYRLEDSTLARIVQGHFPSWHVAGAPPNELHGSRNSLDNARPKAHRKKAAMSYYYAPMVAKSASSEIYKNFPGNGKPNAFYVMENSRKPAYYHKLLP